MLDAEGSHLAMPWGAVMLGIIFIYISSLLPQDWTIEMRFCALRCAYGGYLVEDKISYCILKGWVYWCRYKVNWHPYGSMLCVLYTCFRPGVMALEGRNLVHFCPN